MKNSLKNWYIYVDVMSDMMMFTIHDGTFSPLFSAFIHHTQQIKMCVYLANIAHTHSHTHSLRNVHAFHPHIHQMINEYRVCYCGAAMLIPYRCVLDAVIFLLRIAYEYFPSVSFSDSKINLEDIYKYVSLADIYHCRRCYTPYIDWDGDDGMRVKC